MVKNHPHEYQNPGVSYTSSVSGFIAVADQCIYVEANPVNHMRFARNSSSNKAYSIAETISLHQLDE